MAIEIEEGPAGWPGGTPKILLARVRVIPPANSFRFFGPCKFAGTPYRGHALQQLAGMGDQMIGTGPVDDQHGRSFRVALCLEAF